MYYSTYPNYFKNILCDFCMLRCNWFLQVYSPSISVIIAFYNANEPIFAIISLTGHFVSKKNIIYGYQPIIEAFDSAREIEKLFIQNTLNAQRINDLKRLALESNTPFQFVPKEKLDRITGKNHQGIIAFISEISYTNIETLLPGLYESGKTPFILILDKITDVGNFGAIARSAECAGVHAIVIPAKGSALINADAVKSSAGALNKLPVCRQPGLSETIRFLKNSGLQIIGASEKASQFHFNIDYSKPTAIIMGSEDKGIAGEYLDLCDEIVKIPMTGETKSLNVSVAAGIILFEAVKQRI